MPLPAPALAPTVWGPLSDALPVLTQVRPDAVILHETPGADTARHVDQLRAALPGLRVCLQAPANALAALTTVQASARAATWAQIAVQVGAEVLSFNGEGRSAPAAPGWDAPRGSATAAHLADLARALLQGAQQAAPGLALAWSSHDCLAWHPLPWEALYGAASPCVLSLHQVYPARAGAVVGRAEALGRWRTAQAQQRAAGIRADLVCGGPGAVAYTQAHGLTVDAACALYDLAPHASAWAIPREMDDAGVLALRVDAELRRRAGHAPGRIARFQANAGLAADGVVGPRTLAALGIA